MSDQAIQEGFGVLSFYLVCEWKSLVLRRKLQRDTALTRCFSRQSAQPSNTFIPDSHLAMRIPLPEGIVETDREDPGCSMQSETTQMRVLAVSVPDGSVQKDKVFRSDG